MKRSRLAKTAIAIAAGAGLALSTQMHGKGQRARRGELDEPSIVEQPAARAIAGIPNSAFGIAYYATLLGAVWFSGSTTVWRPLFAGSLAAASLSAYLAGNLLFVTRMPCPYCWTSHAINALIPLALLAVRE